MLNLSILTKVFLRGLFLQAVWNFERMQNYGFLYAILPALRVIYKNDESKLKDAALRHLNFFNTHPYFAFPILGASIKMEEDLVSDNIAESEDINLFKIGLMGSYGAIGDSFFWGGLKPFSAILSILIMVKYPLYAPFVLILIYNLISIPFRIKSLGWGYIGGGYEAANKIMNLNLPKYSYRIKMASVSLLGIFLASFLHLNFNSSSPKEYIFIFMIFVSIFFLTYIIRKGLSVLILITGFLLGSLIYILIANTPFLKGIV